MNINLNIFAAIRTIFLSLITLATSLNRVATIIDKGLQLGENRIDQELADQEALLVQTSAKRDQRVAKKVKQHDDAWELS